MSEAKSRRTLVEIQQEYQSLCLKAGEFQYKKDALKRDLDLINSTIRDLQSEFESTRAAEEAEAKAKANQPKESENG